MDELFTFELDMGSGEGCMTEERLELSEDEKAVIDGKLQMIQAHIKEQPEVTVTYSTFPPRK